MKLTVITSEPAFTRIESAGDITLVDFAGGAQPMQGLLGPEGYRAIVLLDLAKSSYIDSSGIGWLLQCHSRFQKMGGLLVLHSIPPMVNHCFRVLGMYGVLHLAPDEAAASRLATEVHHATASTNLPGG
jgi:anti-anti-sigma factor